MDVKLVMFKRDGKRKDFRIHQPKTIIGRGETCALRIPLLNVSRQHCDLLLGEDELRVRDLASSNGTFVNNRRINETVLKAGDRLVIGPIIFTVQIDGVPEEITPIPSKAEKADEVEAGAPPATEGEEAEVVELQPDEQAEGEDSDPIAALEAMADEPQEEDKDK